MGGFPDQPKVGADGRSSNVVHEVGDEKGTCYEYRKRGVKIARHYAPDHNHEKEDNNCGTFDQRKEASVFLLCGILGLVVQYVVYSSLFSTPILDFLLLFLNPVLLGKDFLNLNYSRVAIFSWVTWLCLLVIVNGAYKVLPQKMGGSKAVITGILGFLFLPLILTWVIWPYKLVDKLGWTIGYLIQVWLIYGFSEI